MADKINIDAHFTGTVEFQRFDFVGKNETPTIKISCTDGETGRVAWGDMWCSAKALPYTVERLRSLGLEGETDDDVIDAFAEAGALACEFDTEENGGYYNAVRVVGVGAEIATGGGGASAADWKAKVFGAKSEAAVEETDAPF